MIIRILGCHGSDDRIVDDGVPHECSTCGFLINDEVLLDAGTIATKLDRVEQRRIRYVILTHIHLDHIRALPNLADNLAGDFETPLTILGTDDVYRGLRAHIFNNHVYPDFFAIPDPQHPVLRWRTLTMNQPNQLGDVRVIPVQVNHTVPAIGCIIADERSAVLFTGDTGPTEELWQIARGIEKLRAIFIECSYPNAMDALAQRSKHLTPNLLAHELTKIGRPEVPVYPYHLKPAYESRIREELGRIQMSACGRVREGDTLSF